VDTKLQCEWIPELGNDAVAAETALEVHSPPLEGPPIASPQTREGLFRDGFQVG
jgi:hypothetical protein